ncbi:MAG: sigma factor-like helix-turn-helix DNA-binding protein, partial [Oscillospiraceae bacterium]|nr:sigma factor-like helix-turn-helix DNA-binding protein [Oscillospiraceae bacterium]
YRKLRREYNLVAADELLADSEDFTETVESLQGVADIRAMVEGMGHPDREIFLRRYFLCQSIKEISHFLNMGEKAVESRLFRGRQKLKTQLEGKEALV